MAIIEVKVPQLSESVAEATLLTWHKKGRPDYCRGEPDESGSRHFRQDGR